MNQRLGSYLTIPVLFMGLQAWSVGSTLEEGRSYLKRLGSHTQIQEELNHFPYLTVVTGRKYHVSQAELLAKVDAYFRKSAVAVETPLTLPASAKDAKHLEGMKDCSADYCAIKLNTTREVPKIKLAADKLAVYEQLLERRRQRFLTNRELLGYESRDSNRSAVREMLDSASFVERLYPEAHTFFKDTLWNEAMPLPNTVAYFRSEEVSLPSDRLQPIYRLGWLWSTSGEGAKLFVELHLYSNHYFDSSLRLLEVVPYSKEAKSALVLTDIVEIDELKKSAFIRSLFTGQMTKGVRRSQEDLLGKIL